MEHRDTLLPPRLALVAHAAAERVAESVAHVNALAPLVIHGTRLAFPVDWARDADMTMGQFFAMLAHVEREGEVRLGLKRDETGITGIIVGWRPRTTERTLDAIREAEGQEQDADDAHLAAVEYAPC